MAKNQIKTDFRINNLYNNPKKSFKKYKLISKSENKEVSV